jgi:hypothetical protein
MRVICAVLVVTVLASCDLQGPPGPKGDPGTAGTTTPTTGTADVSGKVVLSGLTDHSGASVVLLGPTSGGAVTGVDGAFKFTALPAGTYTVIGSARSTTEAVVSRSVTVGEHASVVVEDLIFTPLGSLSGTAHLGGQATGNGGIAVRVLGTGLGAFTDDAGRYVINGVMSGLVDVQAEHVGYALATGQVTAVYGVETTVSTLNLTPSAATAGNCVIRGMATLIGKTDHSGTQVRIGAPANLSTTTAMDGSYELTGVPEGVYVMTFANGPYQETIPSVLADSVGSGSVWNGSTHVPLAPIELARGRRLLSGEILYSVAPDGSRIAAAVKLEGTSAPTLAEVVVVPVNGGPATVLTTRALYFRPQFSGNGTKVVFLSPNPDPSRSAPILAVAPASGGTVLTVSQDVLALEGSVDVDGDSALYVKGGPPGTLYSGPLDGTGAEFIVKQYVCPEEFKSVDGGTKAAYATYNLSGACGSATWPVVRSKTGGTETYLGSGSWSSLRFSPDRLKVGYSLSTQGKVQTFATGAEVDTPYGVPFGFTRDSQYAFQATSGGSPGILALFPVGGGGLVGVANDYAGFAASSPDSSKILYLAGSAPWSLKVMDRGASVKYGIADPEIRITSGDWVYTAFDSAGSKVWYVKPPEGLPNVGWGVLLVSPASGGTATPLLAPVSRGAHWAGGYLIGTRDSGPAPYLFQRGVYALIAP